MKVRISVSLPPDLLLAIDEIAKEGSNRSRIIEQAVREFLESRQRQCRDARDLAVLNRRADDLNRELDDVLSYQVER